MNESNGQTRPIPSDDPTRDLFGDTAPTQPATPTEAARPVDPAALPRPRIRAGAIVWGVLLCAIAGLTLWVRSDPAREERFSEWLLGLPQGAAGLIALLVLGALLLLWGGLAAIRRSQERSTPRL